MNSGVIMFTWLPLSASAKASHPSSTTSTNVSGPTHLVVGPVSTVEATSGKEATFVVSSRLRSLEQVSCFSGPPLGSLNDLYAKHKRLHNVDNPLQSVRNPRTHETFMFLFLVIIHGLSHLEGQSLYVVRFRWGIFYWVWIWWKQVLVQQ